MENNDPGISAEQNRSRQDGTKYAFDGQHGDVAWSNHARPPSRPHVPTRSSTLGSPEEMARAHSRTDYDHSQHAKSEDLNHSNHVATFNSSPGSSPMPAFQSLSRPLTPNDSRTAASSSNHSDHGSSTLNDSSLSMKRMSTASLSTAPSVSSKIPGTPASTVCAACSLLLEGAFVRALGNVWHLQCFKCKARVLFTFHPKQTLTA